LLVMVRGDDRKRVCRMRCGGQRTEVGVGAD
jgi:hypothetical protein